MDISIRNITCDAADPEALAAFWSVVLGWAREGTMVVPPRGAGPRLNFERVPERKTAKNRVHLDINVADRLGHVRFLEGHGATRVRDVDSDHGDFTWTVMLDPEGNEFCVVDLPPL
jgi:predicted enzyme related to lactoylglutathione lyase